MNEVARLRGNVDVGGKRVVERPDPPVGLFYVFFWGFEWRLSDYKGISKQRSPLERLEEEVKVGYRMMPIAQMSTGNEWPCLLITSGAI